MLARPMRSSRSSLALARVRQALVTLTTGLLIAFHLALLWQRFVEERLFEPLPVIRWLATIGLLFVLYRWKRRGLPLFHGRGPLVFWLVVVLLHASFLAPVPVTDQVLGPGLLWALPAFTLVLGIVFPHIRRLLARLLGRRDDRTFPRVALLTAERALALRGGYLPSLFCRPPPAR